MFDTPKTDTPPAQVDSLLLYAGMESMTLRACADHMLADPTVSKADCERQLMKVVDAALSNGDSSVAHISDIKEYINKHPRRHEGALRRAGAEKDMLAFLQFFVSNPRLTASLPAEDRSAVERYVTAQQATKDTVAHFLKKVPPVSANPFLSRYEALFPASFVQAVKK